MPVIPAQGSVKNYHWGKVGNDSYIARFQEVASRQTLESTAKSSNALSNNVPKHDTKSPLAELWFGSHPSGLATLTVDNQSVKLDNFLAKNPEMVGLMDHYQKYDKKLPYLFKILSIAQPLSLQAHPDKKLAQILHKKDPKNYPDSNHKPELAIALTDFEVLCDFRPAREIAKFITDLAPLARVVGDKNRDRFVKIVTTLGSSKEDERSVLADCFKCLLTSDSETITREIKHLLSSTNLQCNSELITLVGNLEKLYPGDPGVFAPFFLNHLKLKPGQAIYLKANKLHAYIKGECIECMACSDNVVRAGLTTKFRDIDTLISMLDYETVKSAQDILFEGTKHKDVSVTSYAPTQEFKVDKVTITQESHPSREYTLSPLPSGSFIVVLGGKAVAENFFDLKVKHKLELGSAGFVPPKIALKLNNIQGTVTIYRSYC